MDQYFFDWLGRHDLAYVQMILDQRISFEVYIWWKGERILVEAERCSNGREGHFDASTCLGFEEFLDEVCLKAACRRDEILFILQDGHEMNAENFQVFKSAKDRCVFAFLTCKSDQIQDSPKFPQRPEFPQVDISLPSYASPGSTMDLQLTQLQKRLGVIKSYLDVILGAVESLGRYGSSIGHIAEILSKSSRTARKSLELHLLLAKDDLELVLSTAAKQLESIDALLHRCPLDFAMMKRIPIKQGVLANCQEGHQTLFDIQHTKWHDSFRECQELRDVAFALKESMEHEYQWTLSTLDSNQPEPKPGDIGLCSAVHQFWTELSAAIEEIGVLCLANQSNNEEMSENLLLVQKSSKLLNLAESASKYSEAYLKTAVGRLRKLFDSAEEEGIALISLHVQTKRKVDDVINGQETLARVLTAKLDLLGHLEALRSKEAILDEIHAFPVAYVALLCELIKRATFEHRLKASFCTIEKKLASALKLELQRREDFKRQIASLIDGEHLGSGILDSRMDGNVVLFINETQPTVSLQDIESLEHRIEEDISSLSSDDPIGLQLRRFLETLVQMKKRSTTIPDVPNLEKSICSSRTADESTTLKTYEERIRSLERLLQENYAAARVIQREDKESIDLSQQVDDLSGSIIRLMNNGEDLKNWKETLIEIAKRLEISGDYKDPATLKTGILKMMMSSDKKLSISEFGVGDTVLILPTVRSGVWSLFNVNEPHYYLHPQSLECLRKVHSANNDIDWLLGKISAIEAKKSHGKSSNPYRLPNGLSYFEVHAAPYSSSQDKPK